MYGIFTFIWLMFMVNVDKYAIHLVLWVCKSKQLSPNSSAFKTLPSQSSTRFTWKWPYLNRRFWSWKPSFLDSMLVSGGVNDKEMTNVIALHCDYHTWDAALQPFMNIKFHSFNLGRVTLSPLLLLMAPAITMASFQYRRTHDPCTGLVPKEDSSSAFEEYLGKMYHGNPRILDF